MLRDSHHLFDLLNDFDDAFRSFFNEPGFSQPRFLGTGLIPSGVNAPQRYSASREGWFRPSVEAFTRDGNLVVRAELPGVNSENIEVIAEGRTLTIRGEKKAEHTTEEGRAHIREVMNGRFERTLTLPEDVSQSDIRANHNNGVLELTIPLRQAVEPKRIPIQSSDRKAVGARQESSHSHEHDSAMAHGRR